MAEHKIKVGEDTGWKKLYLLRDLTRRIGVLHELQVAQLRMWPLVMINAKTATCAFDYDNRTITYTVEAIDKPKPKNFEERLKYLDKSVKQLLGDEYSVLVTLKGKQIFWSPPNE